MLSVGCRIGGYLTCLRAVTHRQAKWTSGNAARTPSYVYNCAACRVRRAHRSVVRV